MTHVYFVAASYGLFLIVAGTLTIGAQRRLVRVTAKLRALDNRQRS